ncbi:MAG: aa3-type cytochrome c oxidase subunit IV [Pseudorhodobacter sp.]
MATEQNETEYQPGSMNIAVQEKTFAGFIRMVAWGTGITIAVLIFLALANS